MEDIVVVGAGLAGYRVVQALRKGGYTRRLTVVGDEQVMPYDRPPLSKRVLAGTMAVDELFYPVDDLDVSWRLGVAAAGLDTAARRVELDDDTSVGYDALVIATGRGARRWPLATPSGVHVIRTHVDALALKEALRHSSAAVVVGAGFIGCEAAATMRDLGLARVTVVDVADRPMMPLGPQVGEFAMAYHEAKGVDFRMGRTVAAFREDRGRVTGVALDDGELLPADVVLLGIGSVPNTGWLNGSGLPLAGGAVACDEFLFVEGRDDVLAVGDVAASPRTADGAVVAVEHWSNARETAEVAAHNLLVSDPADRKSHVSVPTFWSDQYDLKIKSAGHLGLAESFDVVDSDLDADKPTLVVEARRNGHVVAAVTVNKNRKFIEYSKALVSGASV